MTPSSFNMARFKRKWMNKFGVEELDYPAHITDFKKILHLLAKIFSEPVFS